MDTYGGKLSAGVETTTALYPDSFRVDVYKTRRSHTAPPEVIEGTRRNATRARLDDGSPADIVKR